LLSDESAWRNQLIPSVNNHLLGLPIENNVNRLTLVKIGMKWALRARKNGLIQSL